MFPAAIARVFSLWAAGREQEALTLQRVLALAESATKGGVASLKYAAAVTTAARAGIADAEARLRPRRPYEGPEEGVRGRILETVGSLGGLEDGEGEGARELEGLVRRIRQRG